MPRAIRRYLFPVLGNLKVAIGLLLAIAAGSAVGTVLEQGETVAYYQEHYPEKPALFGFLSYRVILALGLNEVYRSWWFTALLMLFGASLVLCTAYRQWPLLKVARRWFYFSQPAKILALPAAATLPQGRVNDLAQILEQRGYRVFWADDRLYARKGLVGRIGPMVVHFSLILVLLGAIWGNWQGFEVQEMIPSGETFRLENVTKGGSRLPQEVALRVNRFWIDYLPSGQIDQFYSDISVLDAQGQERDRQTISVNHPLRAEGLTVYQASWALAGIRFTIGRSPVLSLPLQRLQPKDQPKAEPVWGTWLPTKPDLSEGLTVLVPDLQGTFSVYDPQGKLLGVKHLGEAIDLKGVPLVIQEIVGSTGLQIKWDPGIPLVYLGFGLLMAGTIASYVSYSQVWALQVGETLYVGGKTNRARLAFDAELSECLATMAASSPPVRLPQARQP